MILRTENFNGLAPKLDDVTLPPSMASKCIDVDLSAGNLKPLTSVADSTLAVTHTPVKLAVPAQPTLSLTDLFNASSAFSFSLVYGSNEKALNIISTKGTDYGIEMTLSFNGEIELWGIDWKSGIYLNTTLNGVLKREKVNIMYFATSAYSTNSGYNTTTTGERTKIGAKTYWAQVDYNDEIYDPDGFPIAVFDDIYFEEPAPKRILGWANTFTWYSPIKILIKTQWAVNYSQYTKYRLTFENSAGQQGPPTDASAAVVRKKNQAVKIKFNGKAINGDSNPSYVHIYRAVLGSDDEDFRHLARVAYGTEAYYDRVASNDILSYQLPIYQGTTPPTPLWGNRPDSLTKVILNPTMYYVGYKNKTLWFSGLREQNHMFPEAYAITLDYDIVDIQVLGSATVALTTYGTYMIWGQAPYEHWTQLISDLGVSSANGIVKINDYLYYVSQNGIVRVAGSSTDIITDAYFTPEQFKALTPSTMRLATANDALYLFTATKNYLFEFESNRTDVIELTNASTTFTATTFTWKSKKFKFDEPVAFRIGRVIADSYTNVTFNLYANGETVVSVKVSSDKPFRLPKLEPKRYWAYEVVSSDTINEVAISQTEEEFSMVQ